MNQQPAPILLLLTRLFRKSPDLLRRLKSPLLLLGFLSLALTGRPQGPFPQAISQSLTHYLEENLPEKIYVHTDKDVYLPGEICWFKFYDVDGYFHRPLDISKVAYIEILAPAQKPVLQAKIALEQGEGTGSFQLPAYLPGGRYRLRAYTQWMKNFSAEFFFEKDLTLISPRKKIAADSVVRTPHPEIRFFPEGGNLVAGIESRVAFQALDENGKGIACQGLILNQHNDTLANFSSEHFGIGSFFFTPRSGDQYRALPVFNQRPGPPAPLPEIFPAGYTLRLERSTAPSLNVNIHAAGGSPEGKAVYLLVHTRGSVRLAQAATVRNGQAAFVVPMEKLEAGITHITLFNADRQPVCERLFFKFPGRSLQLAVETGSLAIGSRKKIDLRVSSRDEKGTAVPASLSMAVYRLDSVQGIDEMNIENYFWLSSDLTGPVESPGYYFQEPNPEREKAIDQLMLTQGWRRFRWETVLDNQSPAFEYSPEYVGHFIKGRLTHSSSGLPAVDIATYLSVPGSRTQFKTSKSDSAGMVSFEMKDFYSEGELVFQTNQLQDSLLSFEILSPFSEKYASHPLSPVPCLQPDNKDLILHYQQSQVQKVFSGNKYNRFFQSQADTLPFYTHPDISYQLDNYVRFTTLEEVFREYVILARVRKRNGNFHLSVVDEPRRQFFELDPLVLVDNVPVFNTNRFIAYDPLKIKKLDIVSRLYFYGEMIFAGIINCSTYKGDLQGIELDPKATIIDYEGLQLQREFYSPSYENPAQYGSRLPDFRNQLYWNPFVNTTEKAEKRVSFYSSDLKGKFAIVLQGMDKEGRLGSTVKILEVK